MAEEKKAEYVDPDEEALKLVYENLLSFYEKVNQEKVEDEDSLAVIMDFWIDYGLETLNKRLNKKYGEKIHLSKDPFAGGLIAHKKTSKKGWPYPPNHPQYKDPLTSLHGNVVDESKVLPPPTTAPPPLKGSTSPKIAPKASASPTVSKANKVSSPNPNNDRKQKRDDEERVTDKVSVSRPAKHTTHQSGAKSPKRIPQSENEMSNHEERTVNITYDQTDTRLSPMQNKSAVEYRKSKHYQTKRRQQEERKLVRSAGKGYEQKGSKEGNVTTSFENIEQFDSPSDIPITSRDLLEAYYGRYNRVLVTSSLGVGALLRWVESHNLKELDKLLISKYGQSINDKEIQKDAIRRKNLERKIYEVFEHYDRARTKRMDIVNLVNVAIYDGIPQLNKELKAVAKESEHKQVTKDQ